LTRPGCFGLTAHSRPGPADARHQADAVARVPKARLEGSARAVAAAGLEWPSVPVELVPATSAESCLAGDRAPDVTSVHQPLREKGRIAAERLLRALSQDPPPPGAELLSTRLVVRDSTAPPQRAGSAAT